jgi:hypothetical protein
MNPIDLHLPGSLQGQQYEYDRHIKRPIEAMLKSFLPILPLFAFVGRTKEVLDCIQSHVVENRNMGD